MTSVHSPLAVPNIHFTAPLYSDYTVSGVALGTGANAPTMRVFRGGIELPTFAGSGPVEEGFFTIHLLHDIMPKTLPTFHIHWGHIIASPTGNVKWQVEYSIAKGYEQEAYPSPTTLSTTHAAGAQYSHHITNDDDMAITEAVEPDMVILGRIFRDASEDTFVNDAYLIQVDMHYQVGQIGTPERNAPFTSDYA